MKVATEAAPMGGDYADDRRRFAASDDHSLCQCGIPLARRNGAWREKLRKMTGIIRKVEAIADARGDEQQQEREQER